MRAKIILIVALMMGLVTTFLFFKYMKQFDQVSVANETLVDVVTAKQPIQRNQKIEPGMVQFAKVPKMGVHPGALLSLAEAEGKFADAPMDTGEVLLKHRVKASKDEAQFVSKKVQDGFRAVSVSVNIVQSVSNLIEPEDFVDVIFTPPAQGGVIPPSTLLLEKVKVLAVGRRMVETSKEAPYVETSKGAPYVEYSTVTLEVKPQDTLNLVGSDEKGTISLALHSRIVPAGNPKK